MSRRVALFARLSALAAALSIAGSAATAQATTRWSAEFVGGDGRYPTHVGTQWYEDGVKPTLRADLTWRLVAVGSTSLNLLTQYEGPFVGGDKVLAICRPTPDGVGCLGTFVVPRGVALGIGVEQAVTRYGALRVGAGYGGLQWLAKYKSGAARPFVEADAAVRMIPHAALVVGVRRMWWTRGSDAHWFQPVTIGLRVF